MAELSACCTEIADQAWESGPFHLNASLGVRLYGPEERVFFSFTRRCSSWTQKRLTQRGNLSQFTERPLYAGSSPNLKLTSYSVQLALEQQRGQRCCLLMGESLCMTFTPPKTQLFPLSTGVAIVIYSEINEY